MKVKVLLALSATVLVCGVSYVLYRVGGLHPQPVVDPSLTTPSVEQAEADKAERVSTTVSSSETSQSVSEIDRSLTKITELLETIGQTNTTIPAILGEPRTVGLSGDNQTATWSWIVIFHPEMEKVSWNIDNVRVKVSVSEKRIESVSLTVSTLVTRWLNLSKLLYKLGQGPASNFEVYFDRQEMRYYDETREKPTKGFRYIAALPYRGYHLAIDAYSDFPPVQIVRKMDYQTSVQMAAVEPLYKKSELRNLDMKVERIMVFQPTDLEVPDGVASIFSPPNRL